MKTVIMVKTKAKTEMIDVTSEVQAQIRSQGLADGFCMLYVPHTTAAVTINENADPSVCADILMALNQIVPREAPYRHAEGNSAAHVKATLVGSSEMIPFESGRLSLGTWQGIFFCEFDGPRTRKLEVRLFTHPTT